MAHVRVPRESSPFLRPPAGQVRLEHGSLAARFRFIFRYTSLLHAATWNPTMLYYLAADYLFR